MKLERDKKFGEDSTCRLKLGIRNLTNLDPSTRKVSKTFILMCSFWAKYILFELEKYRGIFFHETEEGYKTWRGIDSSFQNWHKKFDKFWSEHTKVSKTFPLMGSFWAKYILFGRKKTEELSFIILKSDGKFEGKQTSGLKKDMRIW